MRELSHQVMYEFEYINDRGEKLVGSGIGRTLDEAWAKFTGPIPGISPNRAEKYTLVRGYVINLLEKYNELNKPS